MRQGCAAAFLLFAIPFLYQKKWLRYILLVLIAGTMHRSAFFFLILVFLRNRNFKPKIIRILAAVSFICNVTNFGQILFQITQKIFGYGNVGIGYEASFLNFKPYVMLIFILVLFLTGKYEMLSKSDREQFFVNLFLLSLVFLIFAVQNDILYRVYIYLAMISIPGITVICKNLKSEFPLFECGAACYYGCFYLGYIYMWYRNQDSHYYPYMSVFSK